MNKIIRLLSVLMALFVAIGNVWADDISVEKAMQIAQQFVECKTTTNTRAKAQAQAGSAEPHLAHAVKSESSQKDNVYVINLGKDQGFVIISGDDRADAEVLGYCDHGMFDYNKAPVQLKDLLANYSAGIDSLRQNQVASTRATSSASAKTAQRLPDYMGNIVVGPLLTTTWSQWAPYNYQCPEGCPTGCYPTALAQVMNYWKWPKKSGDHEYDWDNMLDSYANGYNDRQSAAIAQLMADIGKAFGTNYTPEKSPTGFNFLPLIEKFDYEPGIKVETGKDGSDLIEKMIQELDESRPMLYCGYPEDPKEDAHALVVDGYTSTYYFHYNFGWDGQNDGWYKNGVCAIYGNDCTIFTGVRPYDGTKIKVGDIQYGIFANGTAEILKYDIEEGKDIDLVIPNTIKDAKGVEYKVERIRSDAFSSSTCSFKTVTLGENIKKIDRFAFIHNHIETLIIGDKTEVVSENAFETTGVKNLIIGASVKHIGDMAFYACKLENVTCKSPAITVGKNAFTGCSIDSGEWLNHITEIGDEAFSGVSFRSMPHFRNVTKIGSKAFSAATGFTETFVIYPSVKKIAPDAFVNSNASRVKVDEGNPYFVHDGYGMIYNKSKTTLVLATIYLSLTEDVYPETMIRMGEGSINPRRSDNASVTIPNSVEDVTGAFTLCGKDIGTITCLAAIPPVATYATFNDEMFEADPERELHVPAGCENIYRNAPGWSRFQNIIADQPYVLPPSQPDRQYFMILHCSDENQQSLRIPVGSVKNIRVGDYVSGTGASLIVSQNGAGQNAYLVDSITWMRGFVFDNAEVFDLSPENLVAEGQDCTVKLGATVIDDDVQLAIRKAINTVPFIEGTTRSVAFDISLSNDVHELSGVAEIVVPFERREGETLCAGYYDEESGEWKPVFFRYDEQLGAAVIETSHFSLFSVLSVLKEKTARQMMDYYMYYEPYSTLNEAMQNVLEWLATDDPDKTAIDKWKEGYGLWQSLGIDGGYNTLQGFGFSYETIDNAVGMVGWIGTALTFLDIVSADLKGDEVNVAANSLKTISSIAQTYIGSIVGSSALSLGMGLTAFIGVAIENFGTKIQEAKSDYVRQIYNLYYSKRGGEIAGHTTYRSATDWYYLFYNAIRDNKVAPDKLNSYIEGTVREYTNRFWNESADVLALFAGQKVQDSKPFLFTTFHNVSKADQEKISQEYYEELMNGILVSVFQQIKNKLKDNAKDDLEYRIKPYVRFMNSYIGLQILDSSCPEDGKSDYSGWSVRFTKIPDGVTDPENWKKTLSDKGTCKLGYYTLYSLLANKVKLQLTLVDPFGEEHSTYDFDLSKFDDDRYNVIEIDLATGGQEIDAIDRLEVRHEDGGINSSYYIHIHYVYDDPDYHYDENHNWVPRYTYDENIEHGASLLLDFLDFGNNVSYHTEIGKFFREHEHITVDEQGNFSIGNDIKGRFEDGSRTATGKFTIETSYDFVNLTKDEFIHRWNNFDPLYATVSIYNNMLNGTISHKIDCNYTIVRNADSSVFSVYYTGEGIFDLTGNGVSDLNVTIRCQDYRSRPSFNNFLKTYRDLTPEEVIVGPMKFVIESRKYPLKDVLNDHYTGPVKLEYTKKIKVKK